MKNNKLNLPTSATLTDYQKYIRRMIKLRGFDKETLPEKLTLLMEESGELAKAIRKHSNIKIDKNSKEYNPGHEAADVFIYLLDICNSLGVDLEKSFREKEEINKKRSWHKA